MTCRPSHTLLRRATIALTLALAALLWRPAVAEARTRSSSRKSLAKSRYAIGRSLYNAGEYARALVEFQEAYKLFLKPSFLANMGLCYQKLGRLGQALKHFRRYLAKGGSQISHAARRRVKVKIKRILQISTAVTLEVEPAGTVVQVNRRKVGTAPLPGTVRLRNGTHKVVLTHAGCAELTKIIEVGREMPKRFTFKLKSTGKPGKRLTVAALKETRLQKAMLKKGFVLSPKGLRLTRSGKKYWIAGLVFLSASVVFGIVGSALGFASEAIEEGWVTSGALQDVSLALYSAGFPLLAYGTSRQIDGVVIGSDGKAKGAGRGARIAGYVLMTFAGAFHAVTSAWMGYAFPELGGALYSISLASLVTGTVLMVTSAYSGWDTKGQDRAARRESARAFPIRNLRIGAAPTRGGGVMSLGFDF